MPFIGQKKKKVELWMRLNDGKQDRCIKEFFEKFFEKSSENFQNSTKLLNLEQFG